MQTLAVSGPVSPPRDGPEPALRPIWKSAVPARQGQVSSMELSAAFSFLVTESP